MLDKTPPNKTFLSALSIFLLFSTIACHQPRDPSQEVQDLPDLSLDASPQADAAPPDLGPGWAGPLTVATWNVERYFDLRCDTGRCSPWDYEELPSPEGFATRGQELALAIEAMGADIVLLQEVESDPCLEEIQRNLTQPYPIAWLGETGGAASVDVAVLARGRRLEVRGHRHQAIPRAEGGSTTFARELLELHLELEGRHIIVFSAHFKSKSNDDPGRRLAEATAAHQIVRQTQEEHPEALVILGGDLNDTPGSAPLDALESDGALLRVASELSPEDWTYRWQNSGQAIDHLFLAREGGGAYLPGSAQVWRGTGGTGYAGSDHGALSASFVWEEP